jgi:opacity protein-like surface antigen
MFRKIIGQVLLLMVVCGSAVKAYAVAPGMYLGLMTGPSTNSASTTNVPTLTGSPPTTPVDPKSNQWGTGIFLGYKNNAYIGSELGFNFFSQVKFEPKYNVKTAGGTDAHVRNVYVVLKGTVPIGSAFDVYAKVGPTFEYISTSGGLNAPVTQCQVIAGSAKPPLPGPPCQKVSSYQTKYQSKVAPWFAIGASWAMDQSWVVDASINHLSVGSAIKNVTWLALGISYHFVDRYCGQFLCE